MTSRRRTLLVLLVLLAAAAAAGIVHTHRAPGPGAPAASGALQPAGGVPGARVRLVDMRPLLTARQLSAYAATPEEQELSRQAERLVDHATDLAFAVAMRDATESAPPKTPELRALSDARVRAQSGVDEAQARVRQLQARTAAAPEADREALQERLEVAQAELELARDELASAADALQRAGGDPQVRVRRLREVYDAAQKEPRPPVVAAPAAGSTSSLLERYRAWAWHRRLLAQLVAARNDIADRGRRLAARRAEIQARLERDGAAREAARSAAAAVATGATPAGASATTEAVDVLTRQGNDQRRLAVMGRRGQDLQELADTYGAWASVVDGHARAALNRLLWGLLVLLGVLGLGFTIGELVDRAFRRARRDALRIETLRTVARLAVNVVTLLVAVVVAFGVPGEVTTVLGLAGAGLTVALKDFIVAFFGWFILMGRNGIRVGDWVEIEGVGGEVVEIGLFHTVLLETGSWNDAGHPTGRRVSFVNSFAIERHYFNFSTSGQWMWDELRVLVPSGRDPYPVIDGIQRLVEQDTAANARLAESEWRQAASRYRVQTFTAVPGIQVVPTSSGAEVAVRYITRAHERHETRRRLYQAVFELLHGKRGLEPAAAGRVAP